MSALFPHLCDARGDRQDLRKRYFKSLKTMIFSIYSSQITFTKKV
jgi:hypothetical protein